MVKQYGNKLKPKNAAVEELGVAESPRVNQLDGTMPEDNHLDSFDKFVNEGKK